MADMMDEKEIKILNGLLSKSSPYTLV